MSLLVRIVKDWGYPKELNLFDQTPGSAGLWEDIQFTDEEEGECDYLIVFRNPNRGIAANCREGGLWLISHEPPIERNRYFTKSFRHFDKVFSFYSSSKITSEVTHPLIPWMVFKSYDELVVMDKSYAKRVKKIDELVWITSNLRNTEGQNIRMDFKDYLTSRELKLNLFGKGFSEVKDKFDTMSPYKYALAIENFSYPDYWSEKVVDCLLSYCLPFYWGATNLEKYLPAKSFIRIDITKPKEAICIINDTIKQREWENRLEYIHDAREVILNQHQFFPALSMLIRKDLKQRMVTDIKKRLIPANPLPISVKLLDRITYYKNKIFALN